MKKVIIASMVVALVALTVPIGAFGQPSYRCCGDDCNVNLDVKVDVDKYVDIYQTRSDYYQTCIRESFDPAARADAEAVKCDTNKDNSISFSNCLVKADFEDEMTGSFKDFNGIGQSNQAAGNMNNQGNTVAVAAVGNAKTYASSLAAVSAKNKDNEITYGNVNVSYLFDPKQTDSMSGSFNRFNGIGQSNQSAGHMNNQNNVVAVAAGVLVEGTISGGYGYGDLCKDAVAVANSELALNNTCNTICFNNGNVQFKNCMDSSYNNFNGIGQSNQSAGNMNNQVNSVSVAASVKVTP